MYAQHVIYIYIYIYKLYIYIYIYTYIHDTRTGRFSCKTGTSAGFTGRDVQCYSGHLKLNVYVHIIVYYSIIYYNTL